ncbi:hypothetical protein [Mycoplasma simbae]|uniref:hypothetical protein n=1 Tax=Mycoplasma simbae TaxID=36744 RepID=UPI0004951B99|nr:hypothetical protein [Mycoplasma simbae]
MNTNTSFSNSTTLGFFAKISENADKEFVGILAIVILCLFLGIGFIWGLSKGFWPALTMVGLSIVVAIIAFIIATNTDLAQYFIDKNDPQQERYHEELKKVLAGAVLLLSIALMHSVALAITSIIMNVSGLSAKKLKSKGKGVKLNRALGAVVAPISTLPFAVATINIAGLFGYENKPIQTNDTILETLSGGKIKGISRFLPLFTTLGELYKKELSPEKIQDLSTAFKDPDAKYDPIDNTLTVKPFRTEPTKEEVKQLNDLTETISIVLSGVGKTKESFEVFEKALKNVNVSESDKQKIRTEIEKMKGLVTATLNDPTKTSVDFILPPDVKKIEAELTKEQKEQVISTLVEKFVGLDDEQTTKIALNIFDSLLDDRNED